MVPDSGYVAARIVRVPGLLGGALLSCVDTVFVDQGETRLTAAVLLDASDPGAPRPPTLRGMRPVAGQVGIYEIPGSEGEIVARRVPGAWLVVEEEDRIGLRAPVELLEDLDATIHS